MNKMRLPILVLLLSLIGASQVFAQRVIGYYAGWENNVASIQWDKVTDVNFAFLQAGADGSVYFKDSYNTQLFNTFLSTASTKGVRVNISVGGADAAQASNFHTIGSNTTLANTFAINVVNFAVSNGLDGIDIDWEPIETGSATAFTNLMKAIKERIDAVAPHLEVTAAVFPYLWQNGGVTTSVYQYVDHLNLMVYDFGGSGYQHHSTYNDAVTSVDYWLNTRSLPASKAVLGLPFYGRSSYWAYSQTDYLGYKNIINGSTSAAQLDSYNGKNYNGIPTIQSKIQLMIDRGLKGVMIWEISQDATGNLSLLKAIDDKISSSCQKPDLGDNQTICGVSDITLSGVLSSTSFDFKWYKDNVELTGETGETYVVTDGGTYTVETTKIGDASCKRTASVVIDEVIPDPNVGNDIPLCGGSTLDVDATVSTPNLTYTWTKDGAPFSTGAIASVEDPATYVIAISDPEGHCVTNSTSLVASNSGLSVKHDTACVAGGTVDLKILSTGGPFTWFEQELNGSSVHIGNDYSTTINSDKTYWVQNTGGAISKNVGLSDRGDGTNHGWYATYDAQKYMVFDVYQELTIDSVTVYGDWSENEADVVFSVYDENDALVDTKTAHYTADGGPGVAIRLPVGITVPAGNGYKFKLVGSNVALYYGQKSTTAAEDIVEADDWFAYPFTFDNIMQIKTSYSGGWEDKRTYSGIYNWLISTGQPCPRVPVYGVVDATNCSGPQVSIIEPSDADEFAYNTDVTIKVGAVDDGTVDKVEVTIAGSTYEMTLNGGTYEYVWNTGATSGDVAINVTATDNDGLTGSASVDVKVINNNGDPVLTLTADETIVVEGENVVFTWSATDPENDALTYEVKLNGAMQTGWTSPYTWVSSGVQSHTLEVTVTDGNGGSDTKSVSVDVTANQDPTLTLTADQTSVIEGDDVVFTWSATDPESDPLSFLVKLDGATVTWSSPYTWSTTGVTAGNHVVEVVVNDGNGGTDTKTVSVNVVANQDPVLTLTADETSVIEGDEVVFTWSATDPENETLSTTIKLDNNTVSWTSPYTWTSVGIGSHTVEVTVTDPRGGLVTKTVSVNVVANQDPVISLTSDVTTATTGDNVTFTWSATDPEGESPLTVKIELDGVEQTTWSSPQDWTSTTGDHTITVTATDSRGAVVVKSINVSVTDPANTTPVLTFTSTSTAILTGESVDLEWFATDVEDDDATLSSAIVITLDGTVQTGWSSVKTWTPTTAGTYVLVASVTDAGQATTSKSITVTVTDPQNLEPVLTVTATPNSVLVGENVTLNWSATDPENDALTYIVTFDNVDKTNTWNDGEVWVATGGTHELSVTVSDGTNSVTESVTITVTDPTNDAPVLVVNASSLTGVVGDPITFDWSATDTENDLLTYTVLFDNAPVSWNSPNVWTATVGSHTLSITVSDGTNTVTESVTVTITSQGTGNNGVITIVSPTDGEVINNPGEITVDIDVTDPSGATVEKVTYQVTDASGASTFYTVDATAGFDLVWLPDVVGNYTVKINPVDNNGNVIANESKTISITLTGTIDLNPTGIAGAVYINEVSIYPSPATSNATVALTARAAGDVTVEVLDMNGNVVFADNGYMSSSDVFEMNFSVENLPSGIYLTRVTLNGETVTKKLVVQ